MPLDEQSLRRPAWTETRGEWITLGDGQAWLFPKPIIALRPIARGGRFDSFEQYVSIGKEFEAARDKLSEITTDDDLEFSNAVMSLAFIMFGFNYDVPDEAFSILFDMESMPDGTMLQITRMAAGLAPKPLPADESSSLT